MITKQCCPISNTAWNVKSLLNDDNNNNNNNFYDIKLYILIIT